MQVSCFPKLSVKNSIASALLTAASFIVQATAEAQSDLDEAHRRLKDNPEFQFERPIDVPEPEEPVEPPGWLQAIFDFISDIIGFIASNIQNLGWLVLIVAALFALQFVLREMGYIDRLGLFKSKKTKELVAAEPAPYRPDEETARLVLGDADTLAADGRFVDAVHALLYRSIEDIRTKRGAVEAFLTSREIGSLKDLDSSARQSLGTIIILVEGSFFGGKQLGAEDWQTARSAYEEFAFGETGLG